MKPFRVHNNKNILLSLIAGLILITSVMEAQWVKLGSPNTTAPAVSLAAIGLNIFAGSNYGFHRSTDNGATWSDAVNGLPANSFGNISVGSIAVNGTTVFCTIFGKGVFRSTNSGTNWTTVNTGLTSLNVNQVFVVGGNLYAATMGGIFKSTNNGTNWTAINNGFSFTSIPVDKLASNGTNLFAGSTYEGLWLSTNSGALWSIISSSSPLTDAAELSASGSYCFVRSGGDLYRTTDNGAHWTQVYNDSTYSVGMVLAAGSNVFLTMFQKGIQVSTDNGTTWNDRNAGLPQFSSFYSLAVIGTDLYAAVNMDIWKRPLSDFATTVKNVPVSIPKTFSMDQNYPNPFNPSTSIRFSVPERCEVRLTVHNVIGQQVAELFEGTVEAGTYEQSFDGSRFSSGIYFYTMSVLSKKNAGKIFAGTRKMLMVK